METLYKRDTKGKVRSWVTEVEDDQWRTIAGIHNGNLVTSGWRKSDAKNVGRSNETLLIEAVTAMLLQCLNAQILATSSIQANNLPPKSVCI